MSVENLHVRPDGGLFTEIAAPPMSLLGQELVRDLVSVTQDADKVDDSVRVLAFSSADPDYFISRLDLNQIAEDRAEAAKLTGEASIGVLSQAELGGFVAGLAQRISGFPALGHAVVKSRVNAIALAPVAGFRRDADLFAEGVRDPEVQHRIDAAMQRSLQTRDVKIALARMLGS